jgi:hypothetical protein
MPDQKLTPEQEAVFVAKWDENCMPPDPDTCAVVDELGARDIALAILSEQNEEMERLKEQFQAAESTLERSVLRNEALTREVKRLREDVELCKRMIAEYERDWFPPSMMDEANEKVERLREGMEKLFPVEDGYTEQMDVLIEAGLLVPVPSDEAYKEEYGEECTTMYVWAWHPLALLTPTTKED